MTNNSPTLTIFAGISGIDKTQFVNNLINRSEKTKEVLSIDFEEDLLSDERDGSSSAADIPSFLDSPNTKLKLKQLESTFNWISKKIEERPPDISHIFLKIHLTYIKNSEFFPPFMPLSFHQLLTKIPNAHVKIITLIDDVFSIWNQIKEREAGGTYLNTQLRLREILSWRSLEWLRAESLKEYFNKEEEGKQIVTNFLVSVKHPFNTFSNLIFNPKPIRFYLSYPISDTRKTEEGIRDVNDFRDNMHKMASENGAVIFDPVAIDELAMEAALNEIPENTRKKITEVELQEKHRWPINSSDLLMPACKYPIKIPIQQIQEVSSDVRNQITSRDYALVDLSQYLAVYRPFYKTKMSTGVDAEIKHAKENMRKVIVYNPEEDKTAVSGSTHPFLSKVDLFSEKSKFFEHILHQIKLKQMKKVK